MSVEFWLLIGLILVVVSGATVIFVYIHNRFLALLRRVIVESDSNVRRIQDSLNKVMEAHDDEYLKLYDELDSIKIILDGVETNVLDILDKDDIVTNKSAKDYEMVYEKITSLDEANEKEDEDETD